MSVTLVRVFPRSVIIVHQGLVLTGGRREGTEIGLLADGGNHRPHFQAEVAIRNADGAAPAAGVGPAQLGLETFQILDLPGFAPDLDGHREEMDL